MTAEQLRSLIAAGLPCEHLEVGRDDGGEEMAAIALDLQLRAGQAGGDVLLDFGGCGIGHGG